MNDYAEENISTEQPTPRQDARLQGAHGDQERSSGDQKTPRQGAQTPDPGALLNPPDARFPRDLRLRNSGDFRIVYDTGRRYQGRLMAIFVRPNGLEGHRLGITASRKLARHAVDRNRMKRLLRETFRLSGAALGELQAKYDLVLNPRRRLLEVKLVAALEDFEELVGRIRADEQRVGLESGSRKP